MPSHLSPLMGIIPNPLMDYDTPMVILTMLLIGSACGAVIAIGYYDRISSIIAIIILSWLYARNPLIANPSLPVVGWMLLAHTFIPTNSYGTWHARGEPNKWVKWFYPKQIWIAAWVLLAVAYSYSGYTKLLSPSWVNGSAISIVLENPLARDHFLNSFLLGLPPFFLQLLTWGVIIIELLFIVFCFWEWTRKWAWFSMLGIQFGFLVFLNFADLTFPMLLIHALTFDKNWLSKYRIKESAILFYDGYCGLCNGLVRFCLSENPEGNLKYSPLGGQTFKDKDLTPPEDDSIVVFNQDGEIQHKSDAVIYCLKMFGGVWLVIGQTLSLVPRAIRDKGYDCVGRFRYRLAGKVNPNQCPILPPSYQKRILP